VFTTDVTISEAPVASISYNGTPFCKTITTAQAVTHTGNTGGTYSSTAGLAINSITGAITPSISSAGNYTVSYTIPAANGCNAYTVTTNITISEIPSATITYAGSPFCTSVTIAQPVSLAGTTGGTFSAPGGLTINTSTGAITPSTSTPGTYLVTYSVTPPGCTTYTFTTTVTVTAAPVASISYAGPFCQTVNTPQPVTQTGATGGTYSAPAGLSINTSTGAINPSASTAGTYTVTYTIPPANGCGTFPFTASVTITATPMLS
jgi:hypothetical protein